MKFIISGF